MASPRIVNGRRIRQAREAQGWSQGDLAQKLSDSLGKGFHQTKVSRIENGAGVDPGERPAFLAVLAGLQLLEEDDLGDPSPGTSRPPVVDIRTTYDHDDIAEYLGVDRGLVLAAFRTGDLRGRKLGRRWFATADAINAWLEGPTVPSGETRREFATVTRKRAS